MWDINKSHSIPCSWKGKSDSLSSIHNNAEWIFFQFVFVCIVTAVVLKMTFKEYVQKTIRYSYNAYGMFCGVSTTALGHFGILKLMVSMQHLRFVPIGPNLMLLSGCSVHYYGIRSACGYIHSWEDKQWLYPAFSGSLHDCCAV